MSSFLRVQLREGDKIEDILKLFQTHRAKTFYLEIPKSFPLASDVSFLKELKKSATEHEKTFTLITSRSFFQGLFKSQEIDFFPSWKEAPEEIQESKIKYLSDLRGNFQAKTNTAKAKKIKEAQEEENKEEAPTATPLFSKKRIENSTAERSLRGHVFFGFLLLLGLLGILYYWISPSATIYVKPKISLLPFTQNVVVTVSGRQSPENDKNLPQIPAVYVDTILEGEENFPSGRVEYEVTNAKGKVTIYNESPEPKFLVPSRLLAPNGSIFRFKEDITIPPAEGSIPGELVVEIEADPFMNEDPQKPIGQFGNIEAGTDLVFPALSEALQEVYYAKANKGPLVGGSTLARYFVAEEDFERARVSFQSVFRNRGIEELEQEIAKRSEREGRRYIIIDDPRLLKSELVELEMPEDLLGQEVQTFALQGKVRVYGIVFDQSEVMKHLEKRLEKTQDKRKELMKLDDSSIRYRVLDAESLDTEGWVKLSISISGIEFLNAEAKTDEAEKWRNNLIEQIKGKGLPRARAVLINDPEIEFVDRIKISPFWIRVMPTLKDQIQFKTIGIEP